MVKFKKAAIQFKPPLTNIPVFKKGRPWPGRGPREIIITERDAYIVELFSHGLTFVSIARKLGLSNRTIDGVAARLRKDLKCKNGDQLVAIFLRAKIFK